MSAVLPLQAIYEYHLLSYFLDSQYKGTTNLPINKMCNLFMLILAATRCLPVFGTIQESRYD